MSRLALAFLVSPLVPCAVYGVAVHNVLVVPFMAAFAYPFALVLGAPAFVLLRRKGWLKYWQVVVASTFLGLLSFGLLVLITGGDRALVLATFGLVFAGSAALCGTIFWLIALRPPRRAL